MANYLDDLVNDILSEERGVTTTPASSSSVICSTDSDLFYRIKHMNETQLNMLEKQIERRKEQLEESKTKNPYKFPEDDSSDVI